MINFIDYFKELDFSEKEAEIYMSLYKLWTQPASAISNNTWYERTAIYKILIKLSKLNLVSITKKWNIKYFFIQNNDNLKHLVESKFERYKNLKNNFWNIDSQLNQLKYEKNSSTPQISLYDWINGIENIFSDIINTIENKKYISLKFFSSNVVNSQNNSENKNLSKVSENFFKNLKQKKVSIETFLWNWVMVMEKITKSTNFNLLNDLPASNSGINIFIVWKSFYMILLKKSPFWIKIESDDLANSMHCIFDSLD
jgi:sugar-specific transcriptional regulator TrmB